MKLKGILDFSLGNFLCLRGFARLGDLYNLSEPDPSFQRDLLKLHERDMVAFLREGEFLFFPEVILSTTLSPDADNTEEVSRLFENVRQGQHFNNLKFPDYRLSCSVSKTKSEADTRAFDFFQTATLQFNTKITRKFSRIDGNHRLSATPKDKKFESHNTPFCLLFFRNTIEAARFSRALFHNINYRSVPLTMEQNLKLILDDPTNLFPDDKLKSTESFGWPYYHARKLRTGLDFDVFNNLRPFIEKKTRTFLVDQFSFLIARDVLGDNENAVPRFKAALVKVNALFDAHPALKDSKNRGLLAALVYYELKRNGPIAAFVRWVLSNHLHLIEHSSSTDLIQIFDKVLESRKRTIFVSMEFGDKTNETWLTIEKSIQQINETSSPGLKLEPIRIDKFDIGHSFTITDEILALIEGSGLLIADLTLGNKNVYHELGYLMGLNRGKGRPQDNFILLLDNDRAASAVSKDVGFNIANIQQIRFKSTRDLEVRLTKMVQKFYSL